MAQFWIAIFFMLLAIAQLYQFIKDINLPFSVYLVLGTVLAVAANPQHKFSFIPSQQVTLTEIKTPDPVLTTTDAKSPQLTTTNIPEISAPAIVKAIEPLHTSTPSPAADTPETTPTLQVKTKKPRTPKAASKAVPKSKTV
jgi:hypothetical protein